MTKMNSLYFKNSNGEFVKTVNLDSPSFIGTPTVPTPNKRSQGLRITNVEFIRSYIRDKLYNFGINTITSFENVITLYPNKEYIINASGLIDIIENTNEDIILGYVAILDNEDNVIAKSDINTSSIFRSTGGIIQSASIACRTPLDGIIKAFVNYNGTKGSFPANFICAIKIDRDEICNVYMGNTVHQEYYLTTNGENYSGEEFTISKYSVYKVIVVPEIGYKPGEVTPAMEGIVDGDIKFSITDAAYDPCVVTIEQTPNQTITVTSENIDHTDSFVCRYNEIINVTVTPNSESYTAGSPNITECIVTDNLTINATSARPIYCKITVRQMVHQSITITSLDTGESSRTLLNVLKGTRVLVEVTVDDGYNPGELNVEQYFYANEDTLVTSTRPTPIEDE